MKMIRIQSPRGYIKHKDERSASEKMRLEVQVQMSSSESDARFFFKDSSAAFRVRSSLYAGVAIRVRKDADRTTLAGLEEHAITLTVAQTESLITDLKKMLDELTTSKR